MTEEILDPMFLERIAAVPQEKLNEKFPETGAKLSTIAREIPNWKAISSDFGLSEADEHTIEANHPFNLDAQRVAFLRTWRSKHYWKASYRNLAYCFHTANQFELVDKVCEILGEPEHSSIGDEAPTQNQTTTKVTQRSSHRLRSITKETARGSGVLRPTTAAKVSATTSTKETSAQNRMLYICATGGCIILVIIIAIIIPTLTQKNTLPVIPGSDVVSETSNTKIKRVMKRDSSGTSTDIENLIRTPGATGAEVVEACVNKIRNSATLGLPEDNRFLRRIAYVMSRDGQDMKLSGGIWQVSLRAFEDTKDVAAHKRLPSKYYRIYEAFEIDWPSVKFSDLEKPFYSALAARLYLSNFPKLIPPAHRVGDQARYWRYYYVSGVSNIDEETFKRAVHELED